MPYNSDRDTEKNAHVTTRLGIIVNQLPMNLAYLSAIFG
jgi:hypothetical protein